MADDINLVSRVKAGAAWLDDNYPGWHNKVNMFSLDMRTGEDCILGQVGKAMARAELNELGVIGMSTYGQFLDLHWKMYDWPVQHGFCFPDEFDGDPAERIEDWVRQVTLLWISAICVRIAEEFDGQTQGCDSRVGLG